MLLEKLQINYTISYIEKYFHRDTLLHMMKKAFNKARQLARFILPWYSSCTFPRKQSMCRMLLCIPTYRALKKADPEKFCSFFKIRVGSTMCIYFSCEVHGFCLGLFCCLARSVVQTQTFLIYKIYCIIKS